MKKPSSSSSAAAAAAASKSEYFKAQISSHDVRWSANSQTEMLSVTETRHFSAYRVLSSPVVCWCLWKEPVCWWWDEDADLQMDRVTADAWSDHHWQPQPCSQSGTWWRSPPPCSRVLVASLPKWSAKWLSTHPLSYASGGVYGTFPAWCSRCDSPVESLRATQSSQWTRSHSVSSAWRSHTEKGGLSWLKQHNFVICRHIWTKFGDKVYIWLFDSQLKFHAKICTQWWNINKSRRGLLFCVHPVYTIYIKFAINNSSVIL